MHYKLSIANGCCRAYKLLMATAAADDARYSASVANAPAVVSTLQSHKRGAGEEMEMRMSTRLILCSLHKLEMRMRWVPAMQVVLLCTM